MLVLGLLPLIAPDKFLTAIGALGNKGRKSHRHKATVHADIKDSDFDVNHSGATSKEFTDGPYRADPPRRQIVHGHLSCPYQCCTRQRCRRRCRHVDKRGDDPALKVAALGHAGRRGYRALRSPDLRRRCSNAGPGNQKRAKMRDRFCLPANPAVGLGGLSVR